MSIKGKVYNFTLPYRVKLVPKNWLFKTNKEPKFDIICIMYGKLVFLKGVTNAILSEKPITAIQVLKCPKGFIVEFVDIEVDDES